jgi:hypothetical protein
MCRPAAWSRPEPWELSTTWSSMASLRACPAWRPTLGTQVLFSCAPSTLTTAVSSLRACHRRCPRARDGSALLALVGGVLTEHSPHPAPLSSTTMTVSSLRARHRRRPRTRDTSPLLELVGGGLAEHSRRRASSSSTSASPPAVLVGGDVTALGTEALSSSSAVAAAWRSTPCVAPPRA